MVERCKEEILDIDVIRKWYGKTIRIKKEHRALWSENIEDALISPDAKGLIAYNRWSEDGKDTVTVVVNTTETDVACRLKTRFDEKATLCDLLSGKKVEGKPVDLRITIPAYSSAILVETGRRQK